MSGAVAVGHLSGNPLATTLVVDTISIICDFPDDGPWRSILVDSPRVRMGQLVLKYFEGKVTREDGAIAHY